MVQLKLPTVDKFLNYLPLEVGGYVIGAINLVANVFAAILQLRKTIDMNLKEFNGTSDQCKSASFYGFNELMSSNTVLSVFISFYLISGVTKKNSTKILPFLVYLIVYILTSLIHMMSVHEGHVAFGLALATFHIYSFIVIYSILMKILEGKPEKGSSSEEKDKMADEESGLGEGEAAGDDEEEEVPYIA